MSAANLVFVDTNVFIYAVSADNPGKRAKAGEWLATLWQTSAGRLSWQVLSEFYLNAVRKTQAPKNEVRAYVDELMTWKPIATNSLLLHRGWHWTDKAQVSWWDALIVGAAELSDCQWLLTEDLQAGQRFASVTVVNPFDTTPEDLGLKQVTR